MSGQKHVADQMEDAKKKIDLKQLADKAGKVTTEVAQNVGKTATAVAGKTKELTEKSQQAILGAIDQNGNGEVDIFFQRTADTDITVVINPRVEISLTAVATVTGVDNDDGNGKLSSFQKRFKEHFCACCRDFPPIFRRNCHGVGQIYISTVELYSFALFEK